MPTTFVGYYVIRAIGGFGLAKAWLVVASIYFYGFFKFEYTWIILASLIANYCFGRLLQGRSASELDPASPQALLRKAFLFSGIAFNLGLLGYYKYSYFVISNLSIFDTYFHWPNFVLPIGISFFTFQQIAYLVDSYYRKTQEADPIDYALFVTFFPQLIAGPIVHHREMMPQFNRRRAIRLPRWTDLAVGLTILSIGLAKKVVLADNIAAYSTPIFEAAHAGREITTFEGWLAAVAYTLQLYFDFSGYSDMAIGLARLFGIRLPPNFFSPYKSANIIEFWRRWHMTLSRFLRDYLYIPMGGNRHGEARRMVNLFLTMLIGGLWHGAGWTFVLWGAVHGVFLIVNHLWRRLTAGRRLFRGRPWLSRPAAMALTLLCVVSAWVLFRAESFGAAASILKAMYLVDGLSLPADFASYLGPVTPTLSRWGVIFAGENVVPLTELPFGVGLIFVSIVLALFAPNSLEIMRRYRPVVSGGRVLAEARSPRLLVWRPSGVALLLVSLCLFSALILLTQATEFLYFQF